MNCIKSEKSKTMIEQITNFFSRIGKQEVPFVDVKETKTQLFFIPASEIVGKEETQGGLITDLKVSGDWTFREIKIVGEPKIIDKKRGIARVVQEIEVNYDNSEDISSIFQHIQNINLPVSVLRIDEQGNAFLMGENKGLKLISFTENSVKLSGEEDDIFYKVSPECAAKIVNS